MTKITLAQTRSNKVENTTSVTFLVQECSTEFASFIVTTLSNSLKCVPAPSGRQVISVKEDSMIDAFYCVTTDDDETINSVISKITQNIK